MVILQNVKHVKIIPIIGSQPGLYVIIVITVYTKGLTLMDKEMIEEYNKALRIASQYTTNIIRIRRLLEHSPITAYNGQLLVSGNTDVFNTTVLIDALYKTKPYINPILIYP